MEYYNNVGMDTKIALCFGKEVKKTDYIYDFGKSLGNITVMQRSDVIDVFDNVTGKKLFEQKNVENFKIEKDAIIFSNGKFSGARLYDGTHVLNTAYLRIDKKGDYFIVTEENSNMGVYKWQDNELKEIIKPQDFTDIRIYDRGISVYKLHDHSLKGYYSLNGEIIVEPKYNEICFNSQGIHVATTDNNKGFYSYSGKEIIPPLYSDIKRYNNCFVVQSHRITNGKRMFGLYNNDGKQIVKPRYTSFKIEPPYVVFSLGELSCVYDLITGRRILSLKYKAIDVYYNAIYATEDFKTFCIYSAKTGEKLLDNKFELVQSYLPYILKVVKDGKFYYYSTQHNILIESGKYDLTYSSDYKAVLINKKGKEKKFLLTEWLNKVE